MHDLNRGGMSEPLSYELMGPAGKPYRSPTPGSLGGHRRSKIYGRLDCRAALQAIAGGGYAQHRIFFKDEPAAIAAGYRPCAVCLPVQYAIWYGAAHRNRRSAECQGTDAADRCGLMRATISWR
jgi:Metal binding domain of Ada